MELKAIVVAIILMLTVGCTSPQADAYKGESSMGTYQRISQKEAYNKMQDGNVIILDVRTQQEYNTGYIKGAELMPLDQIDAEIESAYPDKDAVYLVYCRSGNRSRTASNKMIDLGYKNVFDFGGIKTWEYDIVN